jgi:hypothetical protein
MINKSFEKKVSEDNPRDNGRKIKFNDINLYEQKTLNY